MSEIETRPARLYRIVMYVIDRETAGKGYTYEEYYGLPYPCSRHQENFVELNWHDRHELNLNKTPIEKFEEYFDEKLPSVVDRPFRPLTELEEENKRLKEENSVLKSKLNSIKRVIEK